jgi:hypothetical protein
MHERNGMSVFPKDKSGIPTWGHFCKEVPICGKLFFGKEIIGLLVAAWLVE